MEQTLEVRDVCRAFNRRELLHRLRFSVRKGEFLSILGPSGCGKTTLLRILIGLLPPTSGRILKDGEDITDLPPSRRGMGMVFQNYALFQHISVLGNVEYALRVNRNTRGSARSRALEMIEQLGLTGQIHQRPAQLSGGQQQRVAIARTLVMNPDIILFDEPLSALDAATRLLLRRELKQLQARFHTTMIYITHDQEEAFALSDRIMVLEGGGIHQLDTPEGLIRAPADQFVQEFVIENLHLKIDSLLRYVNG